jgi:hypothetical protein
MVGEMELLLGFARISIQEHGLKRQDNVTGKRAAHPSIKNLALVEIEGYFQLLKTNIIIKLIPIAIRTLISPMS